MGCSEDDRQVRVDFFKSSGKWYCTEAIQWVGDYDSSDPVGDFKMSLLAGLGDRLNDMIAVCLDPYNRRSFPLMVRSW